MMITERNIKHTYMRFFDKKIEISNIMLYTCSK